MAESQCTLCRRCICCPEHCCDFDDCECGDCDQCGGTLAWDTLRPQTIEEEEICTSEQSCTEITSINEPTNQAESQNSLAKEELSEPKESFMETTMRLMQEVKAYQENICRLRSEMTHLLDMKQKAEENVREHSQKAKDALNHRSRVSKDLNDAEDMLLKAAVEVKLAITALSEQTERSTVYKPFTKPLRFEVDEKSDPSTFFPDRDKETADNMSYSKNTADYELLSRKMESDGYIVIDEFFSSIEADAFREEIMSLYQKEMKEVGSEDEPLFDSQSSNETSTNRLFQLGRLAGGRTGLNLQYTSTSIRGDHMAWVTGKEVDNEGTPLIPGFLSFLNRVDQLVGHISPYIAELQEKTIERGKSMIAIYPGNGARYIRHIDNPNKNGRILTCLLYLNPNWEASYGGELRLYLTRHSEEEIVDIAPVLGRFVMFWSNARTPHEVLPAFHHRLAVSIWYSDLYERISTIAVESDVTEEAIKIRREVDKFEGKIVQ